MTEAKGIVPGRITRAGAFGVICALAACSPLERPADGLNFPFLGSYQAARASTPVLLRNDAWWERMDDPVLDQLITRALAQNLDLAVATERITQARAQANTIGAAVSLDPTLSYRRDGTTNGPGFGFEIGDHAGFFMGIGVAFYLGKLD